MRRIVAAALLLSSCAPLPPGSPPADLGHGLLTGALSAYMNQNLDPSDVAASRPQGPNYYYAPLPAPSGSQSVWDANLDRGMSQGAPPVYLEVPLN